jgi:hypothetical protein
MGRLFRIQGGGSLVCKVHQCKIYCNPNITIMNWKFWAVCLEGY